jgi:hypothetical protein
MSTLASRPWEDLPVSISAVLRPELDSLADEIIDTIVIEVRGYTGPLQGGFEEGLRRGVREALRHFLELIEDPVAGRQQDRSVYRDLGRGERRQGRTLDALQSAYRIGARIAWRRWADTGSAAGLDSASLHLLAESIFVYIDELSAESVEGYAAAQAEQAGERERRLRRLFAALTADEPDEHKVREAALEADWALPSTVAAIAIRGTGGLQIAGRLGGDAVAVVESGVTLLLWPDPMRPGARALLARALRRSAAVGPAVPLRDARRSLELAKILLEITSQEETGNGPRWVADELAAVALHDREGALAELRAGRLQPFDDLSESAQTRLAETLLEWLKAQGNRAAAARSLGVHEQTVRYRMNQLRTLFGEQLDDPQARFEIELALRTRPA